MSNVNLRSVLIGAVKWASIVTDLPFGRRKGPRILIYHQVGAGSGLEMDLKVEAFGAQLDWMMTNGEIVDLETGLGLVGAPGSEAKYVLTFDDGHESLFQHAFPLMLERRTPFTLYVTTAPLQSDLLLHGDSRMRLVSWHAIQRMRDSGLMTVGAHGHQHYDARAHPRATLEEDLVRCNTLLFENLGVEPRHFAYPWGHPSEAVESVIRHLYHSAVIGSGPGLDEMTDLYRIPRIPVMLSDALPFLFARKMWGGFRLEASLRSLRDRLARQ